MADSVEETIYTYLTTDSTFSAKFQSIDWIEAPTDTDYPYLVYWLVTDSGDKTYISESKQGGARIQFDVWDDNRIRGARLRTDVRNKVDNLKETIGGISLQTVGITEQTLQRASNTEPFHFVVDGIIQWQG